MASIGETKARLAACWKMNIDWCLYPPKLCQTLCTLTTLIIEMELTMASSHITELTDLVSLLLEKMRNDSSKFMRSIACDCLKELELTYPGLLYTKVGHFHGLCVAENSYIHQNFMALLATVLDHTVQKFLLESQEDVSSPPPVDTLTDLLSCNGTFSSFKIPVEFKETGLAILRKQVSHSYNPEATHFSEVKRAVAYILDGLDLFTPACLVSTSLSLISCIHFTSLPPKILKRLMQKSSSENILLIGMLLFLRSKFGSEICDENDEVNLRQRLMILGDQPTLPEHHRAIVWQWFLENFEGYLSGRTEQLLQQDQSTSDEALSHSTGSDHGLTADMQLMQKALSPSVFDSDEIFESKSKALFLCRSFQQSVIGGDFGPASISDMVVHVLKEVQSGILGKPVVTAYRTLYSQYAFHDVHTAQNKEIERLILDCVLKDPKLIPITIDFIYSIRRKSSESPLPLNVISEIVQSLAGCPLPNLLSDISLYLIFFKHAMSYSFINPVVILQLLVRVLTESTVCSQAPWDLGNALIEISVTAMKAHPTETIFKDLSELLQLMAKQYNDLDVRDRAGFYHQLMLTVSGDKLAAILTLASDSDTGSSLADIVEARISNSVFPSAPPIRKLEDGSTFITIEPMPLQQDWQGYSSSRNPALQSTMPDAMLNEYLQDLENRNGSSTRHFAIHLKYRVHFIKKPQGISSIIYALNLKLSQSKHYHASPDVFVPFLTLEDNGLGDQSSTRNVITLSFYPKEPVPTSFELTAVFSSEEGVTYSTMLAPVSVRFTDMFLPIPSSLSETVSSSVIFSALWKYIESIQQTGCIVEGRHGILSQQHLTNTKSSFGAKELIKFEVPTLIEGQEDDEDLTNSIVKDQGSSVHRVLIFLPPIYHILFKVQESGSSVNVSIASDNWRSLPLINEFLQTCMV